MKATDALTVIALAIDADELPKYTTVELHGDTVTVSLPDNFYRRDFKDHEVWAERVRQRFPGGDNRRLSLFHQGSKTRKILASDRAEYRARIGDNTLVILRYVIPHEHVNYRGGVVDGKPRWTCTGCGKLITITESRRLGLLPPLKQAPRAGK